MIMRELFQMQYLIVYKINLILDFLTIVCYHIIVRRVHTTNDKINLKKQKINIERSYLVCIRDGLIKRLKSL